MLDFAASFGLGRVMDKIVLLSGSPLRLSNRGARACDYGDLADDGQPRRKSLPCVSIDVPGTKKNAVAQNGTLALTYPGTVVFAWFRTSIAEMWLERRALTFT
jgi:hypothetical protein